VDCFCRFVREKLCCSSCDSSEETLGTLSVSSAPPLAGESTSLKCISSFGARLITIGISQYLCFSDPIGLDHRVEQIALYPKSSVHSDGESRRQMSRLADFLHLSDGSFE
jgi:hypothetical protein